MHFDADDPVGLVVVEDDAGGSCLNRDLWDSGIDRISVRGCDLTPGFAVCAGFENDVLERFRVGEALGGVIVEGVWALVGGEKSTMHYAMEKDLPPGSIGANHIHLRTRYSGLFDKLCP